MTKSSPVQPFPNPFTEEEGNLKEVWVAFMTHLTIQPESIEPLATQLRGLYKVIGPISGLQAGAFIKDGQADRTTAVVQLITETHLTTFLVGNGEPMVISIVPWHNLQIAGPRLFYGRDGSMHVSILDLGAREEAREYIEAARKEREQECPPTP